MWTVLGIILTGNLAMLAAMADNGHLQIQVGLYETGRGGAIYVRAEPLAHGQGSYADYGDNHTLEQVVVYSYDVSADETSIHAYYTIYRDHQNDSIPVEAIIPIKSAKEMHDIGYGLRAFAKWR